MAEETDDTDLAERERQAAEDRAFELNPHGTGVDPDIDLSYDYDYEASPELTDADYQPNNSFSNDFTNYGGADLYASQFGQDDEADNVDDDDENGGVNYAEEDYGDEQEDWDGDEEDEDDDWYDDEDNEDDPNDQEKDDKDDDGDDKDKKDKADDKQSKPLTKEEKKAAKEKQKKEKEAQARKQKEDDVRHAYYNGIKVKWKKGDPVNLAMLSETWGQCRKINDLRSLMDQVNEALDNALLASGTNLMIKFNKYLHSLTTQDDDMMGSLLQLANSSGKRLALTTGAVVEAIFDQQWMQPVMLATVPATLSGIIATQPLQFLLQKLCEKAVPIINRMAKDQAKATGVILPK